MCSNLNHTKAHCAMSFAVMVVAVRHVAFHSGPRDIIIDCTKVQWYALASTMYFLIAGGPWGAGADLREEDKVVVDLVVATRAASGSERDTFRKAKAAAAPLPLLLLWGLLFDSAATLACRRAVASAD